MCQALCFCPLPTILYSAIHLIFHPLFKNPHSGLFCYVLALATRVSLEEDELDTQGCA